MTWAGPRLVSGGADGIVRVHDAADLTAAPVHELPALPLAVSSLSSTRDGTWALATSLDGTAALVDVARGKTVAKVETGRAAVAAGESGECADTGRALTLARRPPGVRLGDSPDRRGVGVGGTRQQARRPFH